jgi:hypothetical protein
MRKALAGLAAAAALAVPAVAEGTHARPKGATPVRASLVPAYEPCTAPDRTHGTPLAFPSCSGPQQTSDYLTVGSPDANGFAAKSVGTFKFFAFAGNPGPPPDNKVFPLVDITDVRCMGVSAGCPVAGEDYSGSMEARVAIRNTDHYNGVGGGGNDAATGDFMLTFEIVCVATADPTVGGTCSRHIGYIDEIIGAPGIEDTRRTSWEFERLQLWDGGADGDGKTAADNTLLAVQGIFIP